MQLIHLENATRALEKRGPDYHDTYLDYFAGLGHRRLSVIDTSAAANQPMTDDSGRYTIVFNGEIYNYKSLRSELVAAGISFTSESDTEVLLKLFAKEGEACLKKLNGFFAFAIHDKELDELFIARDRIGIKPLLYYQDEDKFLFASEMKSLLEYGIPKELNHTALSLYLELNYLPAPLTMLKGISKLLPGHFIKVSRSTSEVKSWYQIPKPDAHFIDRNISFESAQTKLIELLEESVKNRLVADVPLGAFLSGGIDSSVITALASRHVSKLNTFSVGYKDDKFFDETSYANLVAKKFDTNHTVFSLTQNDLLSHIDDIVNYIDDPFADSSAIPVYILSQETRKHVTVALSGDGADEVFSGYNKHAAWLRAKQPGAIGSLLKTTEPILRMAPKSRSSGFGNKLRQAHRFGKMLKFKEEERYWFMATFQQHDSVKKLMKNISIDEELYNDTRKSYLKLLDGSSFNHFLYTDCHLVLPNDMLTKVDLMSMANRLEVRVPFLDHRVVEFAFSLPESYKINKDLRKRILQESFKDILPAELYNRPKKGFEVPLRSWFRNQLKLSLDHTLFNRDRLESQELFNVDAVLKLKRRLNSMDPGDSHAHIWALYVFQNWYEKYFSS